MVSKILDFFSTKSVSHKIIHNTLSEKQLFLYFYFIMTFGAITFAHEWINISNVKLTLSNLIFIWGCLGITAIGLIVLYIANGASQGRNFLTKFFSFSFTVGFKYEIALDIISRLPRNIPILKISYYSLISWLVIHIVLIVNIAYRMHQTRELGKHKLNKLLMTEN